MASYIAQHFKWYGLICKICGLMFIQGLDSQDEEDMKLTWLRFYCVYSACCMVILIFSEWLFFWSTPVSPLVIIGQVQPYSKYVFAFGSALCRIRLLLNIYFFLSRSRLLLHFFKDSLRYENRVFFNQSRYCKQTVTHRALHCVVPLTFIANVLIGTYVSLSDRKSDEYTNLISSFFNAFIFLNNFLFYVYDTVHFVVLKPCAEVLILYVRHQHCVLRDILETSVNTAPSPKFEKISQITINLWYIRALKNTINQMWGHAVVMSIFLAVFGLCTAIYTTFDKDFRWSERVPVIIYATAMAVVIIDIAATSQRLAEEMEGINQTLYNAPLPTGDEDYFSQINCLHDLADPKEMLMSGCGFFSLDFPLVVMLTGSVITNSVILLQTRESFNTASSIRWITNLTTSSPWNNSKQSQT